jgi:DNA-binding MarR family transcriptional regulator
MPDYENLLLENQLCFALYAATNAIIKTYRPKLKDIGLTYSQYLVMVVLWETEGITIKELSNSLKLDTGTITPLLKRLEKSDMLKRCRNKDDERVVNLFLTKKGRSLQKKAADIQNQVACKTSLSDELFSKLINDLHSLESQLNKG